jgi:hypothetical protein
MDLYPCPWCRSEDTAVYQNDESPDKEWYVLCTVCFAQGPSAPTRYEAEGSYNVIAKLVDDVFRALSYENPMHIRYDMERAGNRFKKTWAGYVRS